MAAFLAADESLSTATGEFYFGGFVAPQREWDEFFTAAWKESVLNARPRIPYLHVTDLKSARGRQRLGFTEGAAERKLDEAVRVIACQGALFPVAAHLNERHLRESLETADMSMVMRTPGGLAKKRLEPDYLCFLRFVVYALHYVHEEYPAAERVDFVVERNGHITAGIRRIHRSIHEQLIERGRPELSALMGELIPDGKERVPLQAADLVCWYTRTIGRSTQRISGGRREWTGAVP